MNYCINSLSGNYILMLILKNSGSVRPQLTAELHYRPSTHQLSTMILQKFTPLYGKIYRGDADFRIS